MRNAAASGENSLTASADPPRRGAAMRLPHTILMGAWALSQAVAQSPHGLVLGSGCGALAGPQATISLTSPMRPGQVTTLQIDSLAPGRNGVLLLGLSHTSWHGVPLPVALDPWSLVGCELLVAGDILLPFPTGNGTFAATFGVPLAPILSGIEISMQAIAEQPTANPVGMQLSRGLVARIAPMPTPTAWVSSISQFGITYYFAAPVQAGQFVNGDWFVVGPATIADITPQCTTVNGRVLHGAMINPDPSTRQHGYDTYMYDGGAPQLYVPALNVVAALSPSNPLVLQPNQALIKSVSHTATQSILAMSTCSVLTAVTDVPPQGSFRPPYAGNDHAPRYDEGMLDWSVLQSVAPAAGMPTFASVLPTFERPWIDHSPGWESRYFHPALNMPSYGRDFTSAYNEAALMCNTASLLADRRALAIRLVQIGIDFWGNKENGCWWEGTGGHGSGRKFPILFAGALLHDSDMLAVGQSFPSVRNLNGTFARHFGEDCQTFYIAQTSATQINWGFGGYTAADIGVAEYGFSHVHWPNSDSNAWATNSYRLCCTANAWIGGVLCARMMGVRDEWNHPALFDYTDRFAQTEPSGWTRSWSAWVGRMWDAHRAQF